MQIQSPKLKDKFHIYVDVDGYTNKAPTNKTIPATIVGVGKNITNAQNYLVFAWKDGENYPINARPSTHQFIHLLGMAGYEVADNINDYAFILELVKTIEVESKIGSAIETVSKTKGGLFCADCKNFFDYAVPNQKNGTLICWSCRSF